MLYQKVIESSLLLYLASIVSVYLFIVFFTIVLFNVKKIKAFFCWNSLDSDFFKYLIIFLVSFYTMSISTKLLSDELKINEVVFDLSQSIFLYIELLMSICFAYYFCKTHQQIVLIKKYKKYIQHSCTFVFVLCGVMNVFGYHSLSIHMAFFGRSTFAIIFSAVLIEQAIGKLYAVCVTDERIRAKMIELFGYKPEQNFTEMFILKLMLQIIVFVLALYLISKSWSYANDYIDTLIGYVINGIKFETFTFHPTRVVTGVIVFCVLYLIFRSISTSITRHAQFEGEEETQVAVASILIYLGFTIALVAALLIAGFDFTGLAIVAGALSVGIGLGLQSIVNNFVSGIILLIEKPIKTGDRINIDGVEGVVKKIRVRSTQILTMTREDMIIPNSDLITHRVTNYMYSDKKLTIFCEVGIAYGSDILRARDLLIEIANRHSEIIKNDKNNKPRVFLRSFGENSMLFQLWFLIRDGNHKVLVKSEIYFEIERVFRENNIIIAFPQRKIHFNLDDLNGIKDSK